MKRYILIVATVALATMSCSRTYDVNPTSNETEAIGFGTWSGVLTKARTTGSTVATSFANGEAFDVYGFKTTATGNSDVFDGDDVTATVSGETITWDYEQHRFWDPAASKYTFFAVLPANKLGAATDGSPYATTGKFNSNTITFDDPTALSNDILVADKTEANGAGESAPYSYAAYQTSPYVQISFNHIASCVDLFVKQDNTLGNAEVKVTELSLINIHKTGTFAVTGYADATPATPTVVWTEASPAAYLETVASSKEYTIALPSGGVQASGKTTYSEHVGTTSGDAAPLFEGYVFMPQTIADNEQGIKLSYTIKVANEEPILYEDNIIDFNDFITSDKDIEAGDYTATETALKVGNWAPKTHYYYYITIGAGNVIQFSASVKAWDTEATGYQYLIN